MSHTGPSGLPSHPPEEVRFVTLTDELWPPSGPRTVVVVVRGPIAAAGVRRLCDHVRALLERGDAQVVTCDLGGFDTPDLGIVDALARLQLTARRVGGRIRVRTAGAEVAALAHSGRAG